MRKDSVAIALREVSKSYRLYPTPIDMVMDLSGINRFFRSKPRYLEHEALKSINLAIGRGESIGIIGRNGSGKTTLLRLITGNLVPTRGTIEVNGQVQALMDMGLGFHQDFTGLENIKASLIYNGLAEEDMEEAISDVIDFVELGEYLHQPLKTYSLGMQSRLGFATATTIKPDILVIDEVLGAGDAYFIAKSAERMRRLTSGGTTLVLVSHAMAQIIQFCDQAIWLEHGQIVAQGETLDVVKRYEAFIRRLDEERITRENQKRLLEITDKPAPKSRPAPNRIPGGAGAKVSRWPGVPGLKLQSFSIQNGSGVEAAVLDSGATLEYVTEVVSEDGVPRPFMVAINTYTLDGKQVLLDWSERVECPPSGTAKVCLRYDPLLLGNGEYVVSIGLYRQLDMRDTSTAIYYDLWDRSFQFKVVTPYPLDQSICKNPGRWHVSVDAALPSHFLGHSAPR